MADAAPAVEPAAELIQIEVVWAQNGQPQTLQLQLPAGASLAQALAAASAQTGQVFEGAQDAGVWGRIRPRSQLLADGDRVELYQPLKVDPKKARRERFAKQGARGTGLFARRRPQSKAGYGA
ncbi:putative ubiquitin-RnfH superfamily antitoxin RatB of RatAB toxin-antitoxin module [Comamonas sp. BIGb0152]|uniref:RnfH family protein n=1 Tax=Comamonas sp. BIGb0152 TaxID=2940601 RepID=UPI002166C714|nr:RnfH family protein [Comamonas sp. BIGb0152]MCS4295425.1 putative ubiquitin-RnfH superfamily antitoxin RatB of RatAB toxin-antitoxin module [Comamonas sp. BIGb0152]